MVGACLCVCGWGGQGVSGPATPGGAAADARGLQLRAWPGAGRGDRRECKAGRAHQQVQAAERQEQHEGAAKVEGLERGGAHLVQQDGLDRAQDGANVDAQLCGAARAAQRGAGGVGAGTARGARPTCTRATRAAHGWCAGCVGEAPWALRPPPNLPAAAARPQSCCRGTPLRLAAGRKSRRCRCTAHCWRCCTTPWSGGRRRRPAPLLLRCCCWARLAPEAALPAAPRGRRCSCPVARAVGGGEARRGAAPARGCSQQTRGYAGPPCRCGCAADAMLVARKAPTTRSRWELSRGQRGESD